MVRLPLEQQAVHGRGVGPRNVAGQIKGRNSHTRPSGKQQQFYFLNFYPFEQ